MSDDVVRNAGHDDWLDALAADAGYYVACENDHGILPPRRACPHCGSTDLREEPLPGTGTVLARTTVHVPTPSFEGDAPYTTAVVDLGPVRVTGQVRGADAPPAVEIGDEVGVDVGETGQGERLVVFEVV